MEIDIDAIVAEVPDDGPSIFHEIDNTLYSIGPGSFTNDIFELLGAENIAAATGEPFPQMSNEAVIAANPEIILLSDEAYGEIAGDGLRAARLGPDRGRRRTGTSIRLTTTSSAVLGRGSSTGWRCFTRSSIRTSRSLN